jgi:hypothetical protein
MAAEAGAAVVVAWHQGSPLPSAGVLLLLLRHPAGLLERDHVLLLLLVVVVEMGVGVVLLLLLVLLLFQAHTWLGATSCPCWRRCCCCCCCW